MPGRRSSLLITRKTYPPNAVLCREGEASDRIYMLLRGSIQIVAQERVIRTVDEPGSFVGELTPLFGQPRNTTLVTCEECECVEIPAAYLEDLLERNPEEEVSVLGLLAERLLKKSDAFHRLEHELAGLQRTAGEAPPREEGTRELRTAILVAARGDLLGTLNYHLLPIGYRVSHSADPVAVLQDLERLHPDLIIFHAGDFPRQWKPLLKLVREQWGPEESVFILITPSDFPFEEAAKAAHMNVNGLVPVEMLSERVVYRLHELLRRYKSIEDKRKSPRFAPDLEDRFGILLTHPQRHVLVGGELVDVSLDGARLLPWEPGLTRDLEVDQRIHGCSLRIGDDIVTVNCRVARNAEELGLEFESFEGDGDQVLFQYLVEKPQRLLRRALGKG